LTNPDLLFGSRGFGLLTFEPCTTP
jgi:hypothetical protein